MHQIILWGKSISAKLITVVAVICNCLKKHQETWTFDTKKSFYQKQKPLYIQNLSSKQMSHNSSLLDSLLHRHVSLSIIAFCVVICLVFFVFFFIWNIFLPPSLFCNFFIWIYSYLFFILLSFSLSLPSFYFFVFHPYPSSSPCPPSSSSSTSFLPSFLSSPEPSAPPQDIKCSSTSSTSLLVSWRPPPLKSQNGVLVGYRVRYQVVGSSEGGADDEDTMEEPAIPATQEQVLLQRLEKWTQYHITVSALTVIGPGPESEPLTCRTDEDGTWVSNI